MKRRPQTTDIKFILDMINSIYSSQNRMSSALINNDLADFFKSLSLSDKCLVKLIDLLNEEVEYLEQEESAGGEQ